MPTTTAIMKPQTKRCPICAKNLPLSAFGIARSRKDQRNLYCKACINEKVKEGRRALKEYKAVQKRIRLERSARDLGHEPEPTIELRLTPTEKVLKAIREGRQTYDAIRYETKLKKDDLGDELTELLLWTKEIRTQVVDGIRIYLINEPEEQKMGYPVAKPFFDVARKAGAPVVRGERRIQKVA